MVLIDLITNAPWLQLGNDILHYAIDCFVDGAADRLNLKGRLKQATLSSLFVVLADLILDLSPRQTILVIVFSICTAKRALCGRCLGAIGNSLFRPQPIKLGDDGRPALMLCRS
jgi:hypothetical protein